MFVYVCFLVRHYYVECTDFMYDSIKILYIIQNLRNKRSSFLYFYAKRLKKVHFLEFFVDQNTY